MTLNPTIDIGRRLWGAAILQFFRRRFTRHSIRGSWLLPLLAVTLLGSILSGLAFNSASRTEDARVAAILELRAEWRVRDFENKLDDRHISLEGLAAFIATQNKIEPAEFHNFVRNIHPAGDASSALSWAPLVKSSDQNTFIAEVQKTLGTDYVILERADEGGFAPAGKREEYLPLLFNETFDNSTAATGLDLMSLPGRSSVMSRARDEGKPIATPSDRVFARSDMRLGFVVYWPVYSTGTVPLTVGERRATFRGVATSRFHFDELLPSLIADTPAIVESIEFQIDQNPVAFYDPTTRKFKIGAASPIVLPNSGLTLLREFYMLGRHWTLISHYSPTIVSSLRSNSPLAWLLFGLGLTLMLAIYTVRERIQRLSVEAIVVARTSELSHSERRFRQIFDDNPIGFTLKSTGNQHFTRVNAAYCRMLGYSAEELLQCSPENLTVPEDRGILFPAAEGTSPEWHPRDKRYITKLGETVYAQVQNLSLGDLASGEKVILSIANDVTQQRKTEATLQQAQKMEAIGNLTGGMAHDFNNLLGIVIGNLDLLRDLRKNDAEADELARDALDASLRGADLTKRLLAFARRQALQPKEVAVNQLVAEITKLLARTLGEQIEISLNLSVDVWPVFVDPAQLDASLTNLATNARDAMPRGGKLVVTTANRTLDADYTASHIDVVPGDYVLIEVSDTGTGMSAELTGRIFEPFYTTKEQGKGTGLGLSMVFGFIKQSGGHINVYSELGVGTTFGLYLPRMTQDAERTEHPAAPLFMKGGGETVLAVEDDAALRRVVVRQLTELGYHVLEAQNAAVAMEVMEHENVDILFSDIVMPGGTTGVELANQVQQHWPKIKIVLTSGFPETSLDASNRSLAPGTRLLTKPYRKVELAAAVRGALDS